MSGQVITVSNQIGGTGKTTIAFHLAHGLSRMGYKILTLDLDPKATLTRTLGIQDRLITYSAKDLLVKSTTWWKAIQFVRPNLYHIPATMDLYGTDYQLLTKPFSYMQLKKKLTPATHEHDFIIIDTPPAFNLFTVNAWNVSDAVIMPFLPGPVVGMDIARTLKDFQEFDVDIQVIFNQVDRKQKSVERAVQFLEQQFRTPYYQGVQIPRSPLVGHAMAHRQPVFDRHPHAPVGQAFRQLTMQFSGARSDIV